MEAYIHRIYYRQHWRKQIAFLCIRPREDTSTADMHGTCGPVERITHRLGLLVLGFTTLHLLLTRLARYPQAVCYGHHGKTPARLCHVCWPTSSDPAVFVLTAGAFGG